MCDKEKHCPFSDDELLCNIHHVKCPLLCTCLALAMKCEERQTLTHFSTPSPHVYVFLRNVTFPNMQTVFKLFDSVLYLTLQKGNLQSVCFVSNPTSIVLLDAGLNCIQYLLQHCFRPLAMLKSLKLHQNKIFSVSPKSFFDLRELKLLNLSGNPIVNWGADIFGRSVSYTLKVLSLKRVHTKYLIEESVHKVHIYFIEGDDFHTCCLSQSSTVCSESIPWYRPCSLLLPKQVFRLLFGVVAVIIFLFDIFALFVQAKIPSSSKAFFTFVVFMIFSDCLLVIYLSIPLAAHFLYLDSFQFREDLWRTSIICFFDFGVVLCFVLFNTCSTSLLSLSRLRVVISPIKTRFTQGNFCTKLLSSALFSIFILCILVTCSLMLANHSLPSVLFAIYRPY